MKQINIKELIEKTAKKLEYSEKNKYKINPILNRNKIEEIDYKQKREQMFVNLFFVNLLYSVLFYFNFSYFDVSFVISSFLFLSFVLLAYLNFKNFMGKIYKFKEYDLKKLFILYCFTILFSGLFLYFEQILFFCFSCIVMLSLLTLKIEYKASLKKIGLEFKNSLYPEITKMTFLKDLEILFKRNLILQDQLLEYGKKLKSENKKEQYYQRALFDHLFYVLYNDSRKTDKGYLTEYLELTLKMNEKKVRIIN